MLSTTVVALYGKGVSKGIAIGKALLLGSEYNENNFTHINEEDIESECLRLEESLKTVSKELLSLTESLPPDAPSELAPILEVHSQLAADASLASETKEIIRTKLYNAQWAIVAYGQKIAQQFEHLEDDYLKERLSDIQQVIDRVVSRLSGNVANILPKISNQSDSLILVASDISPADLLSFGDQKFGAFISDLGGPTSHSSIVARSMRLPAVVGMKNVRSLVNPMDLLIVDGDQGLVIVNPSHKILSQYKKRQIEQKQAKKDFSGLINHTAISSDGVKVHIEANIKHPSEVDLALEMGAGGIGLFRTEFLFMNRDVLPTEEEQFIAYKHVLECMNPLPVTIRTLDIGNDKHFKNSSNTALNPALGLRAIRYCLTHTDIFKTQIDALVKASVYGRLRILLPMISHVSQIMQVKEILETSKDRFLKNNPHRQVQIELGAMVEIPAMAVSMAPFLKELDFVSIGTNDLIQYALAVDRIDDSVANLFEPNHPAILRLIQMVIDSCERFSKPVHMCGEMAGDPDYTSLLLGMGLRHFSMHPNNFADVIDRVNSTDISKVKGFIEPFLEESSYIDLVKLNSI